MNGQEMNVLWEELPLSPGMERERKVKVLLCGDSKVGKKQLACQFAADGDQGRRASTITTIGIDMQRKTFTVGDRTVKMQIWTAAGQDDSMTSKAYRGAEGIVLVYDITNDATFGSIARRLTSLKDAAGEDVIIAIVGNKIDLESEREVSREKGKALAHNHSTLFFETSASTNHNVTELFETLATELLSKRHQTDSGIIILPEGQTHSSTRHRKMC